jgi:hypothetical protein
VLYRNTLPQDEANPEDIRVGRIVLSRTGSVAWTLLFPGGVGNVLEHTARGTKVLDSTRLVMPDSLSLSGSTLHWLEQSGEARSAMLG